KEIRKRIKARELLKEELEEKDDKNKELEKELLIVEQLKKDNKSLREQLLEPWGGRLVQKLELEKKELAELIDNVEYELMEGSNSSQRQDLKEDLEKLLEAQKTISRYFKNAKKIEEICQKQVEITNLEVRLRRLKEIDARNILLIGRTGSGKSTLANVLSNSNKFEESDGSVSKTRDIQLGEFEEKNILYKVIDTVGIGDTELSEQEVLDKIAETAYYSRKGINQILFVVKGRFDKTKIAAYNLVKGVFAKDKDISDYITIVRTDFSNFRDETKCKEDIKEMIANGGELSEIIKEADQKGRIIHVNNYDKQVEEFKIYETSNTLSFSSNYQYVFGSLSEKKSQNNPKVPPKTPPKNNNPSPNQELQKEPGILKVVLITGGIVAGLEQEGLTSTIPINKSPKLASEYCKNNTPIFSPRQQ
ncbi:11972_t:CDS:2, partial [Ambispora leptoticha]